MRLKLVIAVVLLWTFAAKAGVELNNVLIKTATIVQDGNAEFGWVRNSSDVPKTVIVVRNNEVRFQFVAKLLLDARASKQRVNLLLTSDGMVDMVHTVSLNAP